MTIFLSLTSFVHLIAVIPTCEQAKSIVTANKQPTEVVQKIAAVTGIKKKLDLPELIEETKVIWRRAPGTERDSITSIFPESREELMKLFEVLCMSQAIYPVAKEFKYGLIIGGIAKTVLSRLMFLESLCKNHNIRLKELILLTGKRTLNTGDVQETEFLKDHFEDLSDIKNETDMAKAYLFQTDLFPLLKKIPLTYIASEAAEGKSRAGISDTVADWIASKPEAGSCLAVSSNPFIAYQDVTLRTKLPDTFTVETCGNVDPRLTGDLAIGQCLDSLHRWIFQYNEWAKEVEKFEKDKASR